MVINKISIKRIMLLMILVTGILFSACGVEILSNQSQTQEEDMVSLDFDEFVKSYALSMVAASEFDVHQFIRERSNYEIEEDVSSWEEMSIDMIESYYDDVQAAYDQLLLFDYDELSLEQQRTYELFHNYLQGELSIREYYLLKEILAPEMGIHTMIPFYLTLYTFENTEELERYLLIVKDIEIFLEQCQEYQIA